MKVPIYLSGAIRRELTGRSEFGYMYTPKMGNAPIAGSVWFADNGCFSTKGERTFNLTEYVDWLKSRDCATCLGATAPDKVADAVETLKRSTPVLPLLRELGYKAALVAQDGLELDGSHLTAINETERISIGWNSFDVLFIGGSTEWKLSATVAGLVHEAKKRGKWVHMGRVNSYKRFLIAALMGCDSVDGTFLAFGPTQNLPRLENWVRKLQAIQTNGGFNNENNIPVWWNQQTFGFRREGLAGSDEDGISRPVSVS